MKQLSIVGISVDERKAIAPKIQEILTKHGESIIMRVGTHDPSEENFGLITLHVLSEKEKLEDLSHDLSSLDGVNVNVMNVR